VCLHDPLAVLTALDDAPVTRAARSLTIDGRGRVRVDGRQGTAHETVIGVDARAAIQRVLDTCTCRRG
jgi:hypothetical protein